MSYERLGGFDPASAIALLRRARAYMAGKAPDHLANDIDAFLARCDGRRALALRVRDLLLRDLAERNGGFDVRACDADVRTEVERDHAALIEQALAEVAVEMPPLAVVQAEPAVRSQADSGGPRP